MRARLFLVTLAAAVAVALLISPAVGAFQLRSTAEPPQQLLGTWRLNVTRSKYSPGPPMKAETRVYTRQSDGVQGVVSRVYADGRMEKFEYLANFGKEMMVTGIPEYDTVTLRKVDDLTSDAVLSHAGNVYGVARRVISPDGKTMTITFDRKSDEIRIHNVAIYDKVDK
jgi:hypothetical protein